MTVCDSCKKEITKTDTGYAISIRHEDTVFRYDGCSIECCAKIFQTLADQWGKNNRNQIAEGKPLIIATDGKITMMFHNGKVYGDWINEIHFSHNAPDIPVLEVVADSDPVLPMEMDTNMFKRYLESIMKSDSPSYCQGYHIIRSN